VNKEKVSHRKKIYCPKGKYSWWNGSLVKVTRQLGIREKAVYDGICHILTGGAVIKLMIWSYKGEEIRFSENINEYL
jgi:hypothetical protein